MDKITEVGFAVSRTELAQQAIDKTLEHPIFSNFPDVSELVRNSRERVLSVEAECGTDDLLMGVRTKVAEILSLKELGANSAELVVARQLAEIVNDLRRRLQFLEDYFNFQVKNFEERLERGDKFSILPSKKFMDAYPLYKASVAILGSRIGADFNSNFRGLASRMGFPVIDDIHDLSDVRAKVAMELWRIYNQDNVFEASNREYRIGTKLPRFADSVYLDGVFEAGYGNFTGAVDQVILRGGEEVRKAEVMKQIDDADVMRLLELSLKTGVLPEDDESKLKAVSIALESDMKTAVEKFSVSVPLKDSDSYYYYFNWRQLLIESKYFGKYGVKIYDIWLTREKLEILTNHRVKKIEGRLKDLFIKRKRVDHMREIPPLFVISEADIDAIKSMGKDELTVYVEGSVLGHKFSPGLRPIGGNIRRVLEIYASEGITVQPVQPYLINPDLSKANLDLLVEKARFFREHPQIPLYMRQIIFSMNKTSPAEIKRRMVVFEEVGITPEWYVHFLHVRGVEPTAKAVNKLKKVMEDYEKIVDCHAKLEAEKSIEDLNADAKEIRAMLEGHVGSENLPELVDLRGLNPRVIKRRIAAVLGRGDKVTLAVLDGSTLKKYGRVCDPVKEAVAAERLAELGYPMDSLGKNITKLRPTTLLEKAELMLELFGKVRVGLFLLKPEAIRFLVEREKAKSEKDRNGRLMRFIEEKGLTQPPEYLEITPERIMAIIDEIESRGVPFKSEYWWWVNATKAQRDNQIEGTWCKISKGKRMSELAGIYEFDVAGMSKKAKMFSPDYIVKYLLVLEQVGHDVSEYWTVMNHVTPVNFRVEMIYRLHKKARSLARLGQPGLSDKEKSWLDRASKIVYLKSIVGEKIEGIPWEFVADELTDAEIDRLREADALSMVDSVLLAGLDRFRNKEKLKSVSRRYRFGYADTDYFTATPESTSAILERIEYLEKLKVPITKELLRQDVYELKVSLEFDDEELDDGQTRVLIYLENIGCDPIWARKLACSGESLADFRAKNDYFASVKLDPEDYGKEAFELADYEDMMDRPLKYRKVIGLRTVATRVRNRYAEARLRQFLGVNWDRGKSVRAAPSAILKRYVFLSNGGMPLGNSEIMANLVTTYSGASIEYLLTFVKKIYGRLDILQFSPEQKEIYIQVLIKAIDVISKMSQGFVTGGIFRQAESKILSGQFDQIIFGAIGAQVDEFSTADLQYLASDLALRVYKDVVEVMSFPEIQDGCFLSAGEERRLLRLKDEGDKRAFDILVVRNLKFVYKIARKYVWSGLPIEDLVQEGNIGLTHAVKKSHYRPGNRLLTYAAWWIRHYIQRYVQNNAKSVRLPVYLQKSIGRYDRCVRYLSDGGDGSGITLERIAEKLEIDLDQAGYLKEISALAKRRESSMDEKLGDYKDAEIRGDLMGAEDLGYQVITETLSRRKFLDELKMQFFAEYSGSKKDRDWDILINRFGFIEDSETMTLEELGGKLSLTRERIRQIEENVLNFIRERPEIMKTLRDLVGIGRS